MWSLIESSRIRFSLHELCDITGLNCETIDLEDNMKVDHIEFWGELKVDASVGLNYGKCCMKH